MIGFLVIYALFGLATVLVTSWAMIKENDAIDGMSLFLMGLWWPVAVALFIKEATNYNRLR